MDDISKRLGGLSPAQRELLERKLRERGLPSPLSSSAAAATTGRGESPDGETDELADWRSRPPARAVRFGLYFFSDDGSKDSEEKYRLVLESAKFADRHGFEAVWTPERHFQDFGGLYPNPSVLSAALAVLTERVEIRAGSVALPLHHPVRVAEEWALVDNLSKGRAAVSFASGWHPDDFIFAPDVYEDRKETMFRHIELIRKLWAGEMVRLPGAFGREVALQLRPKPVRKTLPVWITTSGSAETWARAGEIGANVLAAYVGYTDEELSRRITLYRGARERAGHEPRSGVVTLMLHTFVGASDAEVRERVRGPFTSYLRTYLKQYENVNVLPGAVSKADEDALLAAAFEKYYAERALLGTPAKCARLVGRLAALGVDEVACLVDFGVADDLVLGSLGALNELREHYERGSGEKA
jgi:natural product biosynthesis luciferase-like monooxygenase protein